MEASISDPNYPCCEDAYRAAVYGEVEILMNFYKREPTSSISICGDTIFHVLALNCHTKAAIELLNLSMPINGLKTKNFNGNTALHEAARVGALEIARLMVQKEESLVHDSNLMGETPLYWAAAWGRRATVWFLAMKTSSNDPGLTRNDGCTILHAAVMGKFYGLALEIMDWYPDLAIVRDKDGNTALHLLVQSPSSFRSRTFYSDINIVYSSFIALALFKLIIYFCMPSNAHKARQSFLQENRKQEFPVDPIVDAASASCYEDVDDFGSSLEEVDYESKVESGRRQNLIPQMPNLNQWLYLLPLECTRTHELRNETVHEPFGTPTGSGISEN